MKLKKGLALFMAVVMVSVFTACAEKNEGSDKQGGNDKQAMAETIDPDKKMVALTFDDGPVKGYTKKVMDLLEQYHAKATFFVVGQNIEGNEDFLKRAVSLGYEIGNHSYTHTDFTKMTAEDIKQEIDKTNKLIEDATGVTPKLLRPPFFGINDDIRASNTMTMVGAEVDSQDWIETTTNDMMIDNVVSKVSDGSIVLMHDGLGRICYVLEDILKQLADDGYQFVTVSELFEQKQTELNTKKLYTRSDSSY